MTQQVNAIYSVTAEIQLLQALIKDTSLYDEPSVSEDLFIHKEAKALYKAIGVLIKLKEPVSQLSLLREANKIDDSIEIDIVNLVFKDIDSLNPISFEHSIKTLQEERVKINLQSTLKEALEIVSSQGGFNSDEFLNKATELEKICTSNISDDDLLSLDACFDFYKEDLEFRQSGKIWEFYDPFLDATLTRKASGGQIILISASTGIGKSAYTLNIINNLINVGTPALYFSIEMDKISTMDRLLAMRTEIPVREWYRKERINELIPILEKERQLLKNTPFRFVDNPSMSLSKIQSYIKKFKKIYKTDYVCVFIDLITQVKEFITISSHNMSLASTIEQGVNQLNVIAKEENVCFVCVAQMKRDTDSYKINSVKEVNKLRPTLNDIKNSGALAERSRAVISLFRPRFYIEKYLPDIEELEYMDDILEVSVIKQNQGPLGMGKYIYKSDILKAIPLMESDEENSLKGVSF